MDVGSGLSGLKKLKQLRLDNNYLTTVTPSNLSSCGGHMTHLDLSHNHLTSVTGLGSLSNLEELKLRDNRLTCPPDLGRCRKVCVMCGGVLSEEEQCVVCVDSLL